MRSLLIVNDSCFAYLLAHPLIEREAGQIQSAYFSSRTNGSITRLSKVVKKVHWRYLVYRSLVDVVSRLRRLRRQGSIASDLIRHSIPMEITGDLDRRIGEIAALHCDIAIAFNLDQILSERFLELFPLGVLNCHASRLPFDKGISPALWAFARGDSEIWYSIYRMSGKVDCGEVLFQGKISVHPAESGFSAYARLCRQAGEDLARTVASIRTGMPAPLLHSEANVGNYFGLPDGRHLKMLIQSGRTLWRVHDLVTALFKTDR
jgi:methionyl-tRNA formyltransferase